MLSLLGYGTWGHSVNIRVSTQTMYIAACIFKQGGENLLPPWRKILTYIRSTNTDEDDYEDDDNNNNDDNTLRTAATVNMLIKK